MKIIKSDVYDRDIYDEEVIATGVSSLYGNMIVKSLNNVAEDSYKRHLEGFTFRLEDDNYKLKKIVDYL